MTLRVADGRREADALNVATAERHQALQRLARCAPRSSAANACTSSMTTAESPSKSARASVRALIIMTSSDSGVVIRTCAGDSRKRCLRESLTSPCHLKTSSPTIRAYA